MAMPSLPPEEAASLDAAALDAALPEWQVVCLETTTSTNDEARRLALSGAPHQTVVLAEAQTAGRGRRGARWISPARRNAIISALVRPGPGLPPERWTALNFAYGSCTVVDVPGAGG